MILEVRNITKTYPQEGKEAKGIKDVSLTVRGGTVCGIYGDSGCGKSTLFHIIAGVLTPQAGEITFDGSLRVARDQIGYIMQGNSLISHMTVEQNLLLPFIFLKGRRKARKETIEQIGKVLSQVNLEGYEKKYPGQLSGGEYNRVQIARALMTNPQIILADEPTNGLDKENGNHIVRILRNYAQGQGTAVLISTHENEYLKYCNDVYQIVDGHIYRERK